VSRSLRLRRAVGEVYLALFFAIAPSTVPAWRADPGLRTVAVLSIGEPMLKLSPR
jgi:hypothetical protein